jgi:hypothetical protein
MAKRVVVDAAGDQGGQPEQTAVVIGEPIVIRVKKDGGRKKKKKGSSRASRRLADFEKGFSRAARRVSKSCKNGWDEYFDQRDKSERKRRDGAITDLYVNTSKGLSRAISESSSAITDLVRPLNSKRVRKQIRRSLRSLPMFF